MLAILGVLEVIITQHSERQDEASKLLSRDDNVSVFGLCDLESHIQSDLIIISMTRSIDKVAILKYRGWVYFARDIFQNIFSENCISIQIELKCIYSYSYSFLTRPTDNT